MFMHACVCAYNSTFTKQVRSMLAGWRVQVENTRKEKKRKEGGIQAATCIYYMWTLAIHQLTQMYRGEYFPNYNLR